MSEEEIGIIGECLHAAVYGPFFPEWEFSSIFGLEGEEVARVANDLPTIDIEDEVVGPAINNSMNWLLFYPHKKYDDGLTLFLYLLKRVMKFITDGGCLQVGRLMRVVVKPSSFTIWNNDLSIQQLCKRRF